MKITLKGNVRVKNLSQIQIKSPYTVDLSSVNMRKESKGYLNYRGNGPILVCTCNRSRFKSVKLRIE